MFANPVGNLKASQELGFFLLKSNVALVNFDMLLLQAVKGHTKIAIAFLQLRHQVANDLWLVLVSSVFRKVKQLDLHLLDLLFEDLIFFF